MIDLKKIKYILGPKKIKEFIEQPFSKLACDLLNDISKYILTDKSARNYPDLITFGFWCRRSNIEKLKEKNLDNHLRLGLGKIFHITPSNVPINFAYSFSFGLLAGNSNIVRLPSKNFSQNLILINGLKKILKIKKYSDIKKSISFIKYDHDDEITKFFSKNINARIIWGGDETVNKISSIQSDVRCKDIKFSDRYSLSIINLNKLNQKKSINIEKLAYNFYNDTYIMDQNACSSPHLIIWLGKNNMKKLFWSHLSNIVKKKYSNEDISLIDKYTKLFEDANSLKLNKFNHNYRVIRMNLKKIPKNIDKFRGKWGYFYEYDCDNLKFLNKIINNRFQTLTYFGFNKNYFINFIKKNKISGIDRIVPIGSALDMNIIWDGLNLINELTRIVDIK